MNARRRARAHAAPPLREALAALAIAAILAAGCDSATATGSALPDVDDPWPASSVVECGEAGEQEVDLLERFAANEVTYVTFAAKWCNACKEEAPVINAKIVDGMADEPVEAIQILIEKDAGTPPDGPLCDAWRTELGARFAVTYDEDQELVGGLFGAAVGQLPAHYIVTRDGIIRFRLVDALPENLETLMRDWLP
jgi:thiol-disulfide isomerase/thioredoxin